MPAILLFDILPNAVIEPICSLLLIQLCVWKIDLFEALFTTPRVK